MINRTWYDTSKHCRYTQSSSGHALLPFSFPSATAPLFTSVRRGARHRHVLCAYSADATPRVCMKLVIRVDHCSHCPHLPGLLQPVYVRSGTPRMGAQKNRTFSRWPWFRSRAQVGCRLLPLLIVNCATRLCWQLVFRGCRRRLLRSNLQTGYNLQAGNLRFASLDAAQYRIPE